MQTRVLIVDDSPVARAMAGGVLAEAGYQVRQAGDGRAALIQLVAEHIDVLITEVRMPGGDGFDLMRWMKSTPQLHRIPIVVLTTEAGAAEKARGREAGAARWIVKPYRPESLITAVAALTRDG